MDCDWDIRNMNEPIIKKLEDRKIQLEERIKELENEKRKTSKRISEIQVMIIGLSGELNATGEIIKELKEK